MTALRALVQSRREDIIAIGKRYGASNFRLFGSVARGDDTNESDIDLLVDMAPGFGLITFGRFQNEIEDLLGHRVDLATASLLKERVRSQALHEAVPL